MGSLSVSSSTKSDFDELKPDDLTHDEFVAELIATYKAFEGEPVDHEQLAEELSHTLIPMVEIASYRGVSDCMEGSE